MNRSEAVQIARSALAELIDDREVTLADGSYLVDSLAAAGLPIDPDPVPEPTGDLSMVRVIDADGYTWKAKEIGGEWIPLGHGSVRLWSKIPQPVTVLRPEGDDRA